MAPNLSSFENFAVVVGFGHKDKNINLRIRLYLQANFLIGFGQFNWRLHSSQVSKDFSTFSGDFLPTCQAAVKAISAR